MVGVKVNEMRECVRLSRTLSFTDTAREFYISQSALTKHVGSIEHELGVALFVRTKRGVELTEAGRVFAEGASDILARYDELVSSIDRIGRGNDGPLSVGLLYGAVHDIAPAAKRGFAQTRKDVDLRFMTFEFNEVREAVARDAVDMAVTSSLSVSGLSADQYRWKKLYDDSPCAVVPKGHRLARREVLRLSDFAAERLVKVSSLMFLPDDRSDIAQLVRTAEAMARAVDEAYDLVSIKMLLEQGGCVAVLLGHCRGFFGDGFRFVPLEEAAGLTCAIGAIWKAARESEAIIELASAFEVASAGRR